MGKGDVATIFELAEIKNKGKTTCFLRVGFLVGLEMGLPTMLMMGFSVKHHLGFAVGINTNENVNTHTARIM